MEVLLAWLIDWTNCTEDFLLVDVSKPFQVIFHDFFDYLLDSAFTIIDTKACKE